jgi:Glycosyl hydrolase family 99/Calcineurin-like phosphoesterase
MKYHSQIPEQSTLLHRVRRHLIPWMQRQQSMALLRLTLLSLFLALSIGHVLQPLLGAQLNLAASAAFQPTRSSIYATFYYPWYGNPTADGGWAFWEGSGHSPPNNWAANYLPLPPGAFNPTTRAINPAVGLYSSRDKNVFYWQISQMAQAHLEVAISSWWGRSASPTSTSAGQYATNGRADFAFRQIVTNWMNLPDNPYPNLRWALYYEKEGFSNPTQTELVSDLQYIRDHYINQPAFLKIGGRPVIFVYAQSSDGCAMADRWAQARAQSGVNFYIVLKLFSGYQNCSTQPDSWHQYAPAVRAADHAPYASFISPGFWARGSSVTLPRNLTEFDAAAAAMVTANTFWKLVQTWNEWGEGTSVEPGIQVQQVTNGTATIAPNGTPFENAYIDVLSKRLPALQAGTGAGQPSGATSTSIAPSPTIAPPTTIAQAGSFIFGAGGDVGANSRSDASLRAIGPSGASFFLSLGDADYDETPTDAAWCDYVKARVGNTFPFEIVTGNHEEGSSGSPGPDGYIGNMAACLPDRLGAQPVIPGRHGYAANYYFDYPTSNPIMRVIMISPDLLYDGVTYQFNRSEQTNYNALAAVIDQAKQAGRWVVVGMHKNCLTAGAKSCEIGADLMNLLIQRRVDLVLQGHDHNYQRSRQIAHTTSCTTVTPNSYNPACVVDDGNDNSYTSGAGTIFVISGTVGRCCNNVIPSDSEAGYFARMIGADGVNTTGFVAYTVSATRIDARVINSVGNWGDSFSLVNSGGTTPTLPPLTTMPSPTAAPVGSRGSLTVSPSGDAYVNAQSPGSNYGISTSLRTDGSPVIRSYVRFDVPNLNQTVIRATLRIYAKSGSSLGYVVQKTGSNWTESAVTFSNAPAVGTLVGNSGAVAANTWSTVDITSLIPGAGSYNLVFTSNDSQATSFSSRESTNPPQIVLDLGTSGPPGTATSTPVATSTAGSPHSMIFGAAADAYVMQTNPTLNYGSSVSLRTDGSPTINSYLQFNVQGITQPITNATLRIYNSSASNAGYDVRSVSDNAWTENSITYNNAPGLGGMVGSSGAFTSGAWTTVNVTPLVTKNGVVSFALTSSSSTAINLSSREAANRPQLVVQVGGLSQANLEASANLPAEPPAESITPPVIPTSEPISTIVPTNTALPEQPAVDGTGLIIVESDSTGVQIASAWDARTEPTGASGGSYLVNSDSAATLSLLLQGSTVVVAFLQGPEFGQFVVEVDGAGMQVVDSNAPDYQFAQVTIGGLTEGEHFLRIVPTAGAVAIDAFLVASVGSSTTPEPLPPTVTAEFPPPTAQPVELPTGPTVIFDVQPPAAMPLETVNVDVHLHEVANLYGLQVECQVDPTVLIGTIRADGDAFNASNSFFIDNGYQADGKWTVAATRLQPNTPINGSAKAFTLSYAALVAGDDKLTCSVLAVDSNGKLLPVEVLNISSSSAPTPQPTAEPTIALIVEPTIEPIIAPTVVVNSDPGVMGTVSGVAALPGRLDNMGIIVSLYSITGALMDDVTTDATGSFSFTGVVPGEYKLLLRAPQYIPLVVDAIIGGDGGAVNVGDVMLRSGDTDDNGVVDLLDATFIGANFGVNVPPAPTSADLNADLIVNIADLVLVGGNFGAVSPLNRAS